MNNNLNTFLSRTSFISQLEILKAYAILIWRMLNTLFLLVLYKFEVMKVCLSSSQHYDIIASGVILNLKIYMKI